MAEENLMTLSDTEPLSVVYSNKKHQANYYLWHDENPNLENRDGLFVTMHNAEEHNKFHSTLCCIEVCSNNRDVFGVTASDAGFVGGQEYIEVDGVQIGRDRKYGLVIHSGVVAVRRETTVAIGDYVVPNLRGEAKKSDGNYGYLVTNNYEDLLSIKNESEELPVNVKTYLYINNNLIIASKKNVSALPGVDKKAFADYLKANKIDWKDPADLVKVIDFVANL